MLRTDYERLIKAGRAYKRALRSADSLYGKSTVSEALDELKEAALDLDPPEPEPSEEPT